MMHLTLNGKPLSLDETGLSLEQLLKQQSLADKRIAVELNREIVPRSEFGQTILKPGDTLEIVAAIGGG